MKWCLIVILICLLLWLVMLSIFSFAGHLYVFWKISIQAFCLLFEQGYWVPWILAYISPLSDVWIADIFSQSMCCVFTLLIALFAVQKSFRLMCFYLSIFAFIAGDWGDIAKKSLPRPMSWNLSLCFISFTVLVLSFKAFNSFWAESCVLDEIRVTFHSSACMYPILPTPFFEETVLSPLWVLGTFLWNQLTINV